MQVKALCAAAVAIIALSASAAAQQPLKAAVDGTFPPHAFPKLEGGVQGFNIDLVNEISKQMKRPIEITATQFSGIIPGMQAGTYDFSGAPVTVTKERAESLLFTEGYLETDFQFLVKKETPDIAKLEELKGKVIAVNKGSAYDSWARGLEGQIGWTVESFGTQSDAVQAVLSGRAHANVAGNTGAAFAAKQNPALKLSYLHKTGLVWAFAFRKDDAKLRNEVEDALECLKKAGVVARLEEKWMGTKSQPGSAAVTVFPGYGVPNMPGYDATAHEPKCG
jgi:polar amino acid transport system substrate-binding protein